MAHFQLKPASSENGIEKSEINHQIPIIPLKNFLEMKDQTKNDNFYPSTPSSKALHNEINFMKELKMFSINNVDSEDGRIMKISRNSERKSLIESNILKKYKMRIKRKDSIANKRFYCYVCGKLFKKISHVKSHLQIHDPFRIKHKCRYCDAEFLYNSGRIRHERTHMGLIEKCQYCNKVFKRRYLLNSHLIQEHYKKLKEIQ